MQLTTTVTPLPMTRCHENTQDWDLYSPWETRVEHYIGDLIAANTATDCENYELWDKLEKMFDLHTLAGMTSALHWIENY